jgi:hypothetical protein
MCRHAASTQVILEIADHVYLQPDFRFFNRLRWTLMNVIFDLKRYACPVAALVLLVGQATFSHAQQKILIDFGSSASYRGISVPNPDPKGHYWNSNTPGMLMDLVDLTNAATGMQLGWITGVGTDSYNGPAGDTSFGSAASNVPFTDVDLVALGDLGVKHAAFDFATGPNEGSDLVAGPANNTRFDLIGLSASKRYSLTFYGAHSYNTDAFTTYSVYSDPEFANQIGSAELKIHNPEPEDEATDPGWRTAYNKDTTVTIENLAPGPDGNLYINFVGSTGYFGFLNSMSVTVSTPVGTPGDYNGDGRVDAADYTVWRDNLGAPDETSLNGNGSGSGGVDPADYDLWKTNFGMGLGGGGLTAVVGGQSVPEPGAIVFCLLASVGAGCIRRHR